MVKRSIVAALLVLVAFVSCAYAEDAAPANLEQLPPGVTLVGGQEPIPGATTTPTEHFIGGPGFGYRYRFSFPYLGGLRYGWRYPIGYWNTFGRLRFGSSCLFGRPFGGFFYC